MAFFLYQLFHLILHEIDRFGCFMLKSGFFFKKLGSLLNKLNSLDIFAESILVLFSVLQL